MRVLLSALWLVGCKEPVPCNGSMALCERPFDEVALAGSHNAMSSTEDGFTPPNQTWGVKTQLEKGARGLLLDTYEFEGELVLCHGYCELGERPLQETLVEIRDFMDANPGEVVAIIFEDYITPEQTESAFDEADLTRLVMPPVAGSWPTLGELVAADTRLLVTSESNGPPPDWYQPAWEVYFDTPYSFESQEEFSCDVNRGSAENPLFLVNHWLSTPFSSIENAQEVNVEAVLGARVEACQEQYGRIPNLVAVDFVDVGDLFSVVDRLNGVEL